MRKIVNMLLIMLISLVSFSNVYAMDKISISYDKDNLVSDVKADDMKEALAGDEKIYTFKLHNNTKAIKRLYLVVRGSDNYLAKNTNVTVSYNDKQLYSDKINIRKEIDLKTYQPNQKGIFTVKIKIDEKADNLANMSNTDLELEFLSRDVIKRLAASSSLIDTGDKTNYSWITILVTGVVFLMLRKRGETNEKDI